MSVTSVTVAIPTYRRPEQLAAGLPAVLAQARQVGRERAISVRVLVVDNDESQSARGTVEGLAADDVHYVPEPQPGIAAARNRAMLESHADDLLVFIDDDERPQASWLSALIDTHAATGAAAVMGRVVSVYDDAAVDPWVRDGSLFERPRYATGTQLDVVTTGNLLLDLRQVRTVGAAFDPRIGMSGGEDSLFSVQLARGHALMVFCDESVTEDPVVADRLNREWLLRRALSQGSVAVTVDILSATSMTGQLAARGRALGRAAARVGTGAVRCGYGYVVSSRRHQSRGLRTLFRGVGMLRAALGWPVQEYARRD